MDKAGKLSGDAQAVDVVAVLIEMNMRSHPPNPTELDFMLEAARMDHQMLGKLALQRISKMTHEAVGLWFKNRIRACINRHGSGRQKNFIRGIANDQGWI